MAASNSRWKYSNKASTGPDVPTFKISKPADTSQTGRPAEAQLGKSRRNNLAPGCWESCLELLSLRLFKNHKQLSPDQVVRQIFPLWNGALQISGYTWADLSSKSNNIRRIAVYPS
ncbi:hypothetical protein T4A_3123 [Trichinella pseudospiralis]|uniref:Uncharacterized protein n=1 Tax=Trichinella pseudospiralis TaxID=6337 RepID=A0A0V1EQR4_TRIPS|nr:hypothetical protein T4A_3123 [Trichinella pseudospiralis]